MPARNPGRALVYLRRSTEKQDSSLEMQLGWAMDEAKRSGIALDASMLDLAYMLKHQKFSYKDIRLDDGISGSVQNRPGFLALETNAHRDPTISHIFVHKIDRLGRPTEAAKFLMNIKNFSYAGITLVMSDRTLLPIETGKSDVAYDLSVMVPLYASGDFSRILAERVLRGTQQALLRRAKAGGPPAYGFVRILVDEKGNEVEELEDGKRVKKPGHYVTLKPKDMDKIAVWIQILNWKYEGWGNKKIVKYLNEQGIPSPSSGKFFRVNGVKVLRKSYWSTTQIRAMAKSRLLLGEYQYGKVSGGKHRRSTADGYRISAGNELREDGTPRFLPNKPEDVIKVKMGFDSMFSEEKHEKIVAEIKKRAHSQSLLPKARNPNLQALSGLLYCKNCGHVMYGVNHGDNQVYHCGRNSRSAGAECHRNKVNAGKMLRFVLRTLQQLIEQHGSKPRLKALLEKKMNELAPAQAQIRGKDVASMQKKHKVLEAAWGAAKRRMATEEDDERYKILSEQVKEIAAEMDTASKELAAMELIASNPVAPPEGTLASAIALVDDLQALSTQPDQLPKINPMLRRLGFKVGLDFKDGIKGKVRVIRTLNAGVMVFGSHDLPPGPYRPSEPDPDDGPVLLSSPTPCLVTGEATGRTMRGTGQSEISLTKGHGCQHHYSPCCTRLETSDLRKP